jgi:hypothetical protein
MNLTYFKELNQRGIYGIISYDGIAVFYSENMLTSLSKQLQTNKQLRANDLSSLTILLVANEHEDLREQYEIACSKLKLDGWNILNYKKAVTSKLVKEVIETSGGYKIRVVLKNTRYRVLDVIGIFDNEKEYQLFSSLINKLDSPNAIRAYNKLTKEYYVK